MGLHLNVAEAGECRFHGDLAVGYVSVLTN